MFYVVHQEGVPGCSPRMYIFCVILLNKALGSAHAGASGVCVFVERNLMLTMRGWTEVIDRWIIESIDQY